MCDVLEASYIYIFRPLLILLQFQWFLSQYANKESKLWRGHISLAKYWFKSHLMDLNNILYGKSTQ
jgi:hypothetical protein